MMKEVVAIAGPVFQKLASRKALCIIEISFVGCITELRAALWSICRDRCRIYGLSVDPKWYHLQLHITPPWIVITW
jgi:hypothetical protein